MVRNAKAKVNRIRKNYGIDVSTDITLPKLNSITTRKEFNKIKDDIQIFTNRANTNYQFKKNKYGVVSSVKEINELKRQTKKAQKVAKKIQQDNANKPYMSDGVQYGTVGQREQLMGRPNTAGIYIPPDFDFNKVVSEKHLEEKKENIKERSDDKYFDKRKTRFKESYMKAIGENFNSLGDELIKMIEEINPDDLFEMYLQNNDMELQFYYDNKDIEGHVEKVKNVFERYNRGSVNLDLKGF